MQAGVVMNLMDNILNGSGQSDIRFFQPYKHRWNLLAKFEHMRVPPTLRALDAQLRLYDMMRSHSIKLTSEQLERELRAFLSKRNGEYVTVDYAWENLPTGFWLTTPETVCDDFLKQKKEWERYEASQ